MNRQIVSVEDVDSTFLSKRVFDLAIFASGYEERARAVASGSSPQNYAKALVLGFVDGQGETERQRNDDFFSQQLGCDPIVVQSGHPGQIATLIQNLCLGMRDELRILVDISAMARSWYADIINWARFASGARSIEIEFTYAHGQYPIQYPIRQISRTVSLFGFEGRFNPRLETVAFLGLGYDAVTPMGVLEDLQPEFKFGFVASGASDSVSAAVEKNLGTIEQLDGPLAVVPLGSVSGAFRALTEMISPHVGARNTVFVCLGPKTHVLASLLVAIRFEEVTCLHTQGGPAKPFNVLPTGEVTVCRVRLECIDDPIRVDGEMHEGEAFQ